MLGIYFPANISNISSSPKFRLWLPVSFKKRKRTVWWRQEIWVWFLAPPFTRNVNLNECLNLSKPQFHQLEQFVNYWHLGQENSLFGWGAFHCSIVGYLAALLALTHWRPGTIPHPNPNCDHQMPGRWQIPSGGGVKIPVKEKHYLESKCCLPYRGVGSVKQDHCGCLNPRPSNTHAYISLQPCPLAS